MRIVGPEHLEDDATLPDFLNHEHPSYLSNWENILAMNYKGGGLPWVHVSMNGGQRQKTRSGIELSSWLFERGARICNPPEKEQATSEE